ncbi:hypothetical protein PHYPSEUDO_011541 [Phytophthora pseudosyringae]|uniref:Uncharacterized protein n=1 Tax=Phytophthora pseudosyringae TaxID=221518 RepID=A0A8T1V846_9STRA|nr:hypothetical protein PHYPSEUDO_011541 [Phytophthora pseudosyringae]
MGSFIHVECLLESVLITRTRCVRCSAELSSATTSKSLLTGHATKVPTPSPKLKIIASHLSSGGGDADPFCMLRKADQPSPPTENTVKTRSTYTVRRVRGNLRDEIVYRRCMFDSSNLGGSTRCTIQDEVNRLRVEVQCLTAELAGLSAPRLSSEEVELAELILQQTVLSAVARSQQFRCATTQSFEDHGANNRRVKHIFVDEISDHDSAPTSPTRLQQCAKDHHSVSLTGTLYEKLQRATSICTEPASKAEFLGFVLLQESVHVLEILEVSTLRRVLLKVFNANNGVLSGYLTALLAPDGPLFNSTGGRDGVLRTLEMISPVFKSVLMDTQPTEGHKAAVLNAMATIAWQVDGNAPVRTATARILLEALDH